VDPCGTPVAQDDWSLQSQCHHLSGQLTYPFVALYCHLDARRSLGMPYGSTLDLVRLGCLGEVVVVIAIPCFCFFMVGMCHSEPLGSAQHVPRCTVGNQALELGSRQLSSEIFLPTNGVVDEARKGPLFSRPLRSSHTYVSPHRLFLLTCQICPLQQRVSHSTIESCIPA
jgi:hypothetical protein